MPVSDVSSVWPLAYKFLHGDRIRRIFKEDKYVKELYW
jgi:hypothetical protein